MMFARWFPAVLLASLALPTTAIAQAQPDAQAVLEKMETATGSTDYRGRFVYQYGAESSTVEVVHAVINGVEFERLTHLDGDMAELIRRGDEVTCIHPDRTITRLARTDGTNPLALGARLAAPLPDQYAPRLIGADRVAGREATEVRLEPVDAWRFGYRLWLDAESGLLLKSETVEPEGGVLERLEYVQLELSPQLPASVFEIPEVTDGEMEPALAEVPEGAAGLSLEPQWLPDGFREGGADTRLDKGLPVTAQSYSDGLASFTLFGEPVKEREIGNGVGRRGATLMVTRVIDLGGQPFALSLVGEVPVATAEQVLTGLKVRLLHPVPVTP